MLTRLLVPIVIFFCILLIGSAIYSGPALPNGYASPLGLRSAGYDITYIYDELGRVIGVVDPAGDTVVYSYDAVGNLLSISRYNSNTVSIIRFTPNNGIIGASVTIYGTGFDTTPSQNNVTFNGVTAAVTSATATQIITSVPSGATTGVISVTSPAGSATSSTSFIVNSSVGAPTITGFTPTIGLVGAAVTISGNNFDANAINDRVTLHNRYCLVSSANPTTLATSVPTGATSGRISVATPSGKAVSSGDFFIPPPGYNVSDVEFTGRMAIGETKTVTVSTANKIALVVFDGTQGQRISLKMTNVTISNSTVYIYKSNGTVLTSYAGVGTGGAFIDTQTLPGTGTYTILVDPVSTYTGNMTLTLYDVVDITGSITPGGLSVTVITATPGQNARLTFSGTTGQKVSLNLTGVTINTSYVSIYNPDGTTLFSPTFVSTSGKFVDTLTLPASGTYTILDDPSGSYVGSATLTLYNIVDVSGTIIPGGSPVTATITTPGQNARYTFAGTSGQRISLLMTGVSVGSNVSIYKPDGTILASYSNAGNNAFIDTQSLPTTGTYTILVDAQNAGTGSVTLTLYNVVDVTGSVTVGGSSLAVTINMPGQSGQVTLNGAASQLVTVHVTSNTIAGVTVKLLKPDGSQLTSTYSPSSSFNLAQQTLPTTGTCTIVIDPSGGNTGSLNVSVTSP